MLTPHQARLFAEELQLRYPAGEVRSLTGTLMAARDRQLALSQERNGSLFDQEMEKQDR